MCGREREVFVLPCTTTVLLLLITIWVSVLRSLERRVRVSGRRRLRSAVVTVVLLGRRDVPDVLWVDAVTVSVLLIRADLVRPDVDRRAAFLSTTREADEVFGSILTLFISVEGSLVAIRLVRSPLVFPPASMTFIRDVRVPGLVVVG